MRKWRKYFLMTAVGGTVVVIACTFWSMRPLRANDISALLEFDPVTPVLSHDTQDNTRVETLFIDGDVFAVTLWHSPPEVQVPGVPGAPVLVEAPRKTEPLKVQLVAIIQEDGIRQAALYDMLDDRIVIIADGGMMRDRAVHVSDKAVEFSTGDGRENQRLLLRPDEDAREKLGAAAGSTQS